MAEEILVPIFVVGFIFVGMPWVILHYLVGWKRNRSLSTDDEKLLDDLHRAATRLDERLCSIERILSADDPNWRQLCADPNDMLDRKIEERNANIRRIP